MNTFLISAFFITLIFHGGGSVSFPLFLQIFLVTFVCAITGSVLLKTTKINNIPCRNLLAILLGFIINSLFINAVTQLSGISALYSFIYLSVLVLLPAIFFFPNIFRDTVAFSRNDIYDFLVLLSIILFISIWSWDVTSGFYTLINTDVLHAWEDYYFHGAEIAQFSDLKAVGQGDILLAGMPLTFYHRAIYMIPAVIAEIANLPGVSASTTLLFPLGILLMCISNYALATQLAGRVAGIIAILCLLVLPDSSLYWFKNGFLGFHYSLRVAPGTAFGLAVCFTSMIFFIQGTRDNLKYLWAVSVLLAISIFFFRAHLFALYFPVLIFMLMLQFYSSKKWFRYSLLLTGFSLLLLIVFACFNHHIRSLYLEKSAVLPFLDLVHLQRGENAYGFIFKHISELHKPAITMVIGIAFLLLAILSGWIVLYSFALYFKIKDIGYKLIDFFPLAIILFYIVIVLFSPPVHGLVDEWQHRPFGLLYSTIVIFTIAYFTKLLESKHENIPILIAVIGMLGVLAAGFFPDTRYIRKIFTGASLYGGEYRLVANDNILKSAMYLRKNAHRGDIFLISNVEVTGGSLVDSAIVIASISGVPAYAGNFALVKMPNFIKSDVVNERISFMKIIENTNSSTQAYSALRLKNIAWYVALSPPKWDPTGKNITFKSDSIAVYHILSS